MTVILWLFDGLLAATLLWLGWRLLVTSDLFKAVVLLIAFGLLMAMAWVRLRAPDVALAEAAIGSGLTGALFLAALGHIAPRGSARGVPQQETDGTQHPDNTG